MFVITFGEKIIEITESVQYIKSQANGIDIISSGDDYDKVYSPQSDKKYGVHDYNIYTVDESSMPTDSNNIARDYVYDGSKFSESDYYLLQKQISENKMLKAQLQAQVDRSDFIEDCITEMAVQVYGGV